MENKALPIIKYEEGTLSVPVSFDYKERTIWVSQKNMSVLFGTSTDNIGLHIKNIIKSGELDSSTSKESLLVQNEGKRQIKRVIKLNYLNMVISVSYRVNSPRGIAFRK